MLKRFLPSQEGFFRLFQTTADIIVDSTTQFHTMLHNLHNQQQYVDAIAANEEKGARLHANLS